MEMDSEHYKEQKVERKLVGAKNLIRKTSV